MQLHILGFSPPVPNSGKASSSYLIQAHETQLLVDCGYGAVSKLLMLASPDHLDGIIVSHMHPDHYLDLLALRSYFRRAGRNSVPLFLPPGGWQLLDNVVEAMQLSDGQRHMSSVFDIGEFDPSRGLTVKSVNTEFCKTVHPIATYAMSFAARGHDARLVYTSDTAWCPEIIDFSDDANLLLIEAGASSVGNQQSNTSHLTPREAGCISARARARRTVITHFDERQSERILSEVKWEADNDVKLAAEFACYDV